MRKGNNKIEPISLKINSSVKPTILNGSVINQIIGKRNRIINASGQQSEKRINQRIRAISSFMALQFHEP